MKRSAFIGTMLLALDLAVAPAQPQNSPTPATNYVQATRIVAMKVKDSNGETIGTIKDVVLNRDNGCIAYTVLSTGDSGMRLTGTTKTVAIPWTVYSPGSDPTAMTLSVDRERVYGAPAFEYSRINEYSASYINDVYSYYGVQPTTNPSAAGVNASSTPTEVPAQASSTMSPTATATPSTTPSATPTATPGPSAPATASPSPSAKSPRPWAAAASRPSATPSPSLRRSPNESSEDETGSKNRHHRESVSPTPSAAPERTPE